MQRLRLAGNDLHRFATPDNLHVRLYLPKEGRFDPSRSQEPSVDRRTLDENAYVMRYYTISRIDADAGWIDIDFVLHADAGPGCFFALTASPGDLCGMSGPCGRGLKPCSSCLLIGDDTALPAIARISAALAPDCIGRILALSDMPVTMNSPQGVSITWIRPTRMPPIGARRIADAAHKAMDNVPCDQTFVWAAGEFELIKDLQSVAERVPRDRSLLVPYWRRGLPK